MRGLIVDKHEVDDVRLATDKDDLEEGVPEIARWIGPEEVCEDMVSALSDPVVCGYEAGVPRYLAMYTARYKNCDLKEIPDALCSMDQYPSHSTT